MVSYFLFGIPLAWLLGTKMSYGIIGLELGLGAGILVQLVGFSAIINKADWQEIAEVASEIKEREEREMMNLRATSKARYTAV